MIDAGTQLLFMVGHPVGQTKSPALINPWFQENQLPFALVPVDVAPAGLAPFMLALRSTGNAWGAVFTIPHKAQAVHHVQSLSPVAQCLQAINVARRTPSGNWEGDMLDGAAVISALAEIHILVRGCVAHIVGCGGAGSAAAYSVAAAGAAKLTLVDSDPEKAEALARRLQPVFPGCAVSIAAGDLQAAAVVINASPLGMRATDPLPFNPDAVQAGAVVVDAVTSDGSGTRLAEACGARGLRVVNGNTLARVQQPLILDYLLANALTHS